MCFADVAQLPPSLACDHQMPYSSATETTKTCLVRPTIKTILFPLTGPFICQIIFIFWFLEEQTQSLYLAPTEK